MIFTARYDRGASRLELAGDCRMVDAPALGLALAELRAVPPAALTVRLSAVTAIGRWLDRLRLYSAS